MNIKYMQVYMEYMVILVLYIVLQWYFSNC
jgi:hypothetical protein